MQDQHGSCYYVLSDPAVRLHHSGAGITIKKRHRISLLGGAFQDFSKYRDFMRKQRHQKYTNCPVEAALDIIGGKWKSIILFRIMEETQRFNKLEKLLPRITRRILTVQLRELERDGLITRTVFAEVPPRVEYSITDLGKSLEPVLVELKTWAETYMPERMQADEEEKNA